MRVLQLLQKDKEKSDVEVDSDENPDHVLLIDKISDSGRIVL